MKDIQSSDIMLIQQQQIICQEQNYQIIKQKKQGSEKFQLILQILDEQKQTLFFSIKPPSFQQGSIYKQKLETPQNFLNYMRTSDNLQIRLKQKQIYVKIPDAKGRQRMRNSFILILELSQKGNKQIIKQMQEAAYSYLKTCENIQIDLKNTQIKQILAGLIKFTIQISKNNSEKQIWKTKKSNNKNQLRSEIQQNSDISQIKRIINEKFTNFHNKLQKQKIVWRSEIKNNKQIKQNILQFDKKVIKFNSEFYAYKNHMHKTFIDFQKHVEKKLNQFRQFYQKQMMQLKQYINNFIEQKKYDLSQRKKPTQSKDQFELINIQNMSNNYIPQQQNQNIKPIINLMENHLSREIQCQAQKEICNKNFQQVKILKINQNLSDLQQIQLHKNSIEKIKSEEYMSKIILNQSIKPTSTNKDKICFVDINIVSVKSTQLSFGIVWITKNQKDQQQIIHTIKTNGIYMHEIGKNYHQKHKIKRGINFQNKIRVQLLVNFNKNYIILLNEGEAQYNLQVPLLDEAENKKVNIYPYIEMHEIGQKIKWNWREN